MISNKDEPDRPSPNRAQEEAPPSGKWKTRIKDVLKAIQSSPQSKLLLLCGLVLLLLCLCSYFILGQELKTFVSDPARFQAWIDQLGAFDELLFILLRAVQTVIKFIPAEPLEIGAGYAWGAIMGMIYCVIGNLLGTACIVALSKQLGPRIIKLFRLEQDAKQLSFLQSSRQVYLLLFILYLLPGTPKDSFAYLVFLFPVKRLPFLLITGIARIPSVLSSTLCGANLAQQQYWISALILVVTIVTAIIGGILYRRHAKGPKTV